MIEWFKNAGKIRTILFITAIIGKIIIYIVYQPPLSPSKLLILPFPFLILLTLLGVIFTAIIVIELIRISAHRLTSTWNLKIHFIAVLAVIIVLVGLRAITFQKISIRYYDHAWSLAEKKDYTNALACLEIALMYDSHNLNIYYEKGYVHRNLGNLEAALNDYNTFIKFSPKYANAYAGRGYVFYYLKDYQKAIHDWHQAIAIDPNMSGSLEKWIKAAKEQ